MVWKVLTSQEERAHLRNGYNVHRKRLRTERLYRKNLIQETVWLVNPALKVTEWLNEKLSQKYANRNVDAQPQNEDDVFESIPFTLESNPPG